MSRPRRVRVLLARCAAAAAVVLAGVSGALWLAGDGPFRMGIVSLGEGTDVRFRHGEAHFRHFYDYDFAAPVPPDQWHTTAVARGWTLPVRTPGAWPGFAFSSGHVAGMSSGSMVSPTRYWVLRVPLWAMVLPGVLVAAWCFVRWERGRHAERRGFGVLTTNAPAPATTETSTA